MKHTIVTAKQIMNRLKDIGIKTKLIGGVKSRGFSNNDIDLVLLNHSIINNMLVSKLQNNFNIIKYDITDWGGILIKTLRYGNIDLFPNSFMKKCYYCKEKCCLLKKNRPLPKREVCYDKTT
jgi:hypothetical protein